MIPAQAVCNYSLLRFLPYPETGEFVNVGVAVNCLQPCFLHFLAERQMPARVKALFPHQYEREFEVSMEAMRQEVERVKGRIRDPKGCQFAFNELVRPRENTFRFGEVRTILSTDARNLSEELFRRYVRMESAVPQAVVSES
ncbi:DUF3037 domain-containing protein [Luteolibacter sp. Populi]|uniref:DUF3037 domain-containing protein n=1 Tax=Luteolibacter sp. Populi TaxID=3230487 RepID=UPI003465042C